MKAIFAALLFLFIAMPQARAQHTLLTTADGAVNIYSVNGAQLQLQKSIAVGKDPGLFCSDPTSATVYLTLVSEKDALAINLKTQSVAGKISDDALKMADGCAVSPDGKKLYIADREGDVVFVFSTSTHQKLKTISIAKEPRRGFFLPNGTLVFASGEGSALNVINPATDTVTRTIKTNSDPRSMAVSPDHKRLAVLDVSADVVSYYDAETLEHIGDYGTLESPQQLLFSADGKKLYVLTITGRKVGIGDMTRKTDVGRVGNYIPVGDGTPITMAGDPAGQTLFIGFSDGKLASLDLANKAVTVVPDVKVGRALLFIP